MTSEMEHIWKPRTKKAEQERDDKQGEYDWLIDEINSRLGLPEDEFHSPSPALDGIDNVERELAEARADSKFVRGERDAALWAASVAQGERDTATAERDLLKQGLEAALEKCIEAFRLTREYVGEDV